MEESFFGKEKFTFFSIYIKRERVASYQSKILISFLYGWLISVEPGARASKSYRIMHITENQTVSERRREKREEVEVRWRRTENYSPSSGRHESLGRGERERSILAMSKWLRVSWIKLISNVASKVVLEKGSNWSVYCSKWLDSSYLQLVSATDRRVDSLIVVGILLVKQRVCDWAERQQRTVRLLIISIAARSRCVATDGVGRDAGRRRRWMLIWHWTQSAVNRRINYYWCRFIQMLFAIVHYLQREFFFIRSDHNFEKFFFACKLLACAWG